MPAQTAQDRHYRHMLRTSNAWATRAIEVLHARQTIDEQASRTTRHQNGRGFTAADAEILSSFAQRIAQRWPLSDRQMAVAHKRLPKYSRQLIQIANVKRIRGG